MVDVLIVNYFCPDLTQRAIDAVLGSGARVLLWDNSGDGNHVKHAQVFTTGENVYFAAANNQLFAVGESPLVLLLNPDVELSYESLLAMIERLDAEPKHFWGVTPRLIGLDDQDQNYLHELPSSTALLADRLPPLRWLFRGAYRSYRCLDVDLTRALEVGQPPAAALLLRRRDLAEIGGLFDESYPLFFNDVDLARRLGTNGRRCLYAGDLTATHVGGASVRSAAKRGEPIARMYDEALLLYAKRHLRSASLIRVSVWLRRWLDRLRGGEWG